jgi:hypothetical protein
MYFPPRETLNLSLAEYLSLEKCQNGGPATAGTEETHRQKMAASL